METKLTVSLFVRSFVWLGLMAVVLFGAAGDWTWPQGWAFIAIFVVGSIAFSLWLMKRDPALLASRLEPLQKGQAAWDRIFLLGFIAIWFVWLAFMGVDAVRLLSPLSYERPMPPVPAPRRFVRGFWS